MKFSSDRQRKAVFAKLSSSMATVHSGAMSYMNIFSKGRIPKIGENVEVKGDHSVGISPWNGVVVRAYERGALIRAADGSIEEMGLEEFDDGPSIEARAKFEESLYNDWLEETGRKPTKSKKGSEFSLRIDIEDIIREGKFKLNPAAQSYYEALQESEEYYGEPGVKTQALYLANNLQPVNDEQEKLVRKLQKLGGYEEEEAGEGEISESQFGRLIDGVTDFTSEEKRKRLEGYTGPKIGDKIYFATEDEILDYDQKRGYPYTMEVKDIVGRLNKHKGEVVDVVQGSELGELKVKKDDGTVVDVINEMYYTEPELIGLDDFKKYADERGVSLDMALKANDWIKGYLTPEAAEAVDKADKKIKVKGIDI